MPLIKVLLIIAAVYVILQLLYSGYFFMRAGSLLKNEHTGEFTRGQGKEFSMFAAGDSIGAGVGASSFETSVVGRVTMQLAKNRTVKLTNKSVSGYRMDDLLRVTPPTKKQNLILLVIGSNDLFHFTILSDFRTHTKKVLELYSPKADKVVIIGPGRVFDADAIPFVLKPVYKAFAPKYARVLKDETGKFKNVIYVNPIDTSISNDYGQTGAADRFHPNDQGYRFWFDLLKGAL